MPPSFFAAFATTKTLFTECPQQHISSISIIVILFCPNENKCSQFRRKVWLDDLKSCKWWREKDLSAVNN
ncbi:unnamed protein product [Ceratitis capitata]|uniref:(Mediterranean fruit fly) hypothetical protein n=1 Tax=Ceratitis capitata TaxID=7213 RepID=A0A811UNH7_CERCA|nr:unnamed protein product [Ceratitis capitata]